MWKWIIGGLVVVVVALGATCYLLVKKATSGGDSTAVTIAATPARVFATLANADSMPLLLESRTTLQSTRHGIVEVGDTLQVNFATSSTTTTPRYVWIVSAVEPTRLLALEMRDTSGKVLATRRDSLVSTGDSTEVISSVASPMIDSLRTERGDTGNKMGGALLDLSSRVLITAFRKDAEDQLKRLKAHIEPPRRGAPRP
jgi:uncharacterized protein YndB with AHSA1/START domain